MVGTTLESSVAGITFLADQSTINFHLASERQLSVRASLACSALFAFAWWLWFTAGFALDILR